MAIPKSELTSALAVELFGRTRFSAAVGTIGVGIMAYPHLHTSTWQNTSAWVVSMLVLLLLRVLHARQALSALQDEKPAIPLIDKESILCMLIGVGWGSSVFVFDTGSMDQAFYVRLMILAGAMAFIVASTAVFFRIFLAYTQPIGLVTIAFVITHDYVQPPNVLLLSIALYMLMLIGQALNMNRRIRQATSDHRRVLHLTEDLNGALAAERKLRDELKLVSLTDELTGIYNRRGVADNLATELARARRINSPLSILMIDIDHFKPINDTHGHATGDLVLRRVVQAVKGELRQTDVIGRMGGDEFLVILPTLEEQGAYTAAQRLHSSVGSSTADLHVRGIDVTISVGVASYQDGDDIQILLARADKALYAAKGAGRNRTASNAT